MASVLPQQGPRPTDFYDTQTTSARAVTITCCSIVAGTMILRTLGRYALKIRNDNEYGGAGHYLGLDDVFNFFAVLTFFALAISVLIAIDRGMGTHIDRVMWLGGSEGVDSYSLAIYVCALTYNTVLGLVKLSVLALYRRILQGVPSKALVILNWTVFGLVATNTLVNVFVAAFQCQPIHAAFDSSIKGKCINDSAFYIGNAITGIFTDSLVYFLSIPIVRPLQMDRQRKFVILITLLIGLFAVITSCIRLSFLPALLKNPDATWAMAVPMDWSIVEPTVGILVSSLPAIRSIVYLWNPAYGMGSKNNNSSLKSQIQLQDFNGVNRTTITGNNVMKDDDSERNLIYQGTDGGIFKTTEVQVRTDRMATTT